MRKLPVLFALVLLCLALLPFPGRAVATPPSVTVSQPSPGVTQIVMTQNGQPPVTVTMAASVMTISMPVAAPTVPVTPAPKPATPAAPAAPAAPPPAAAPPKPAAQAKCPQEMTLAEARAAVRRLVADGARH